MTTLEITRSVDIKAPPAKVWAALTKPELIAEWFGDSAEFDPKPGGTGLFGWEEHGTVRVLIEEVDEPNMLVYRWARESDVDPVPGNSTLVRFDLTETAEGTRLTLLETGFEELDDPQSAHASNVKGWQGELGDLVAYLESQ